MRPTGIVDPAVEVRETRNQIDDLMNEIRERTEREERVLVTTLTKKMSEDLTDYLLEMGFKVRYLHSEIDTLERIQIIRELRLGEYDVLVGVNLLREGLDLPEVSLVAILDADKEGFLRGETSLIQTIGRAARNVEGKVLMYADKETAAMRTAIGGDRPAPGDPARLQRGARDHARDDRQGDLGHRRVHAAGDQGPPARGAAARRRPEMEPAEIEKLMVELEEEMLAAAEDLRFEYAAKLRDEIRDLRRDLEQARGGRLALAAGAAALVRAPRPRPPLATHPRPLRDPGLGAHAPADPGGARGRRGGSEWLERFPERVGAGGRSARRGAARLERTGLQPARAGAARRRAGGRRAGGPPT